MVVDIAITTAITTLTSVNGMLITTIEVKVATMVMIDENTYGSLTPAKAKEIIENIKAGEASK